MSDDDEKDWLDPDYIELDPNGPTLEVKGPVRDLEEELEGRAAHIAFMREQVGIKLDMVACDMARELGWTDEQINVLIEIRNGLGHWC